MNPQASKMSEEDLKLIENSSFPEFKAIFPPTTSIVVFMDMFLATRKHLENVMSQSYGEIKEAHKKYAWLSQKMHDVLKYNSIAVAAQKGIKEDNKEQNNE